jgi:hypothetical protein
MCQQGKLYVCDLAASSAPDLEHEDEYLNLRAQLWFGLNDWLKAGGSLPKDDELVQELLAPTYKFAPKGQQQVESKDDIKKKIGRSPDRADAACLAVYRGRVGRIEAKTAKPTEERASERTKGGRYDWKSRGGAG